MRVTLESNGSAHECTPWALPVRRAVGHAKRRMRGEPSMRRLTASREQGGGGEETRHAFKTRARSSPGIASR
ncbi:hypothetical protein BRI6_2553 [plant metagenome]|uniref:Uncharacterized protein n=1 Tax=plant metagenome TaxID=1297885 RepID=A0A484UZ11_9ZZZZ